ncbi:MAG: hypothetical protein JXR68_12105 [Bacteroidales bacterium]|nr:hypothetical protein [Bacteroidales bacterium]
MENPNKKDVLQVLETLDIEKLEQLTKLSLLFTSEELSKIIKKVSNPATKKLILTYI